MSDRDSDPMEETAAKHDARRGRLAFETLRSYYCAKGLEFCGVTLPTWEDLPAVDREAAAEVARALEISR